MDPRLKQIMEQKRTIERLKQKLKRANDQVRFLTMGGCTCKLDQNTTGSGAMANAPSQPNGSKVTAASPAHSSSGGADSKMQQSFKSSAAADGTTTQTINNNYNNNTISIIDGNTITTTTSGANQSNNTNDNKNNKSSSSNTTNSKIGSGIVDPSDITAKDMMSFSAAIPTSEGASIKMDKSGMLPRLA